MRNSGLGDEDMSKLLKDKCRRPRRFQAQLEILEDRSVPATITITGAGRFQDGMVTALVHTSGDNYTATNLRSAIVGANSLVGPDTILLDNGTYTMDGTQGQFVVADPSGTLTIANRGGGISTINAQGMSRIFLNESGLTLSGIKLENGLASDRGGAIFNDGVLNVDNCQFVNNEALGGADGGPVQGGAIFNYANRILNVQNSTFSGNVAQGGTSSALLGGTADAEGGAIFFSGGNGILTNNVLNSTFVGNRAVGGNGALFNGLGSRGGNGLGGALFAEAGRYDLNVINATFAANVAQGGNGALADGGNAGGGGLYLQYGGLGTTRLVNDTIAYNRAQGGNGAGALATNGIGSGGGLADNYVTLPVPTPLPKVINTIVARNAANLDNDANGVFDSLGSNLIGDSTGAAASFIATTGDFTGSTLTPLDPGLDPLANYGGPTQTYRLSAGSFAVDRGNSTVVSGPLHLTNDQRGQARRSGVSVDIGAYETQASGQDKTYSMNEGASLTTTADNGLLAGLNNPLGRTVTVRLVAGGGPAAGNLNLRPDGTFTYRPPNTFQGTVSFRFRIVVDGQETDSFTATITVVRPSSGHLSAPLLQGPSGSQTTPTPTFTWNAVAGADHYDIWIDDLTTGQSQAFRNSQVTGTSWTPSSAMVHGHSYRWWVQAVGSDGETSAWSRSLDLRIAPPATPTLTGPSGTSTNAAPTFTWNAVAGADHYDIWIDDLTTHQSQAFGNSHVTGTSWTPGSDMAQGHSYRWWVQALSSDGGTSAWSRSMDVRIAPLATPTLTGPSGTSASATPIFTWTAVAGADHYNIWIDDLTTHQSQAIGNSHVTGTSWAPGSDMAQGHSYRWWVQALSGSGGTSAWSASMDLGIAPLATPTLTGPSGSTTDATPTFTWNAVAGADHYDIWINDLTTGRSQAFGNSHVTGASWTPESAMVQGHSYRWWVRALSGSGGASAWSSSLDIHVG
jgi:hypothetical protein